jgi:hypothetical protein
MDSDALYALAIEAGRQLLGPQQRLWLDRLEENRQRLETLLDGFLTGGDAEQALTLERVQDRMNVRGDLVLDFGDELLSRCLICKAPRRNVGELLRISKAHAYREAGFHCQVEHLHALFPGIVWADVGS